MMAAGWQPTDVRMTEEDVSGLLTQLRARPGRRGTGSAWR